MNGRNDRLVANAFADQMQTIFFALIVTVLENDGKHARRHENSEKYHRQLNRQIQVNQQGVDAEHDENREIFVKVLNGDGAPGTHQHMTAML